MSSGGTAGPTRILAGGAEIVASGGTDTARKSPAARSWLMPAASPAAQRCPPAACKRWLPAVLRAARWSRAGGTELLESGGPTSGFTLSAGATLELAGGTTSASPVALPAGVILAAGPGETFSGFTVSSGMKVEVLFGGTDSGGTINSGGTLTVSVGGTGSGITISKGGTEIVTSGGIASGVAILSGGTEIAAAGGTASIAGATSGVMLASGSHAEIILQGVTISGGTLETFVSGQIDVSDAGNVLSGVHIQGSVIVETGGTLTLSGGTLSAGAIVETASGGTAIVSDTLTNGGTLYASASDGLVQIAGGAVVNGGIAEVGNGIVDIEGASSEEVSFLAAGSGGLDLDDAKLYTGKVVGFGGAGHSNHSQFIDLTAITYVSGVVSESYHASAGSGVLTVTSSGTVVATIDFVGAYTSGDFHLTSGAGGSGTIITDPACPPRQQVHGANIALFGSYIAASFVSAAGGNGSTLVTESPQANEQSHLAYPHHD